VSHSKLKNLAIHSGRKVMGNTHNPGPTVLTRGRQKASLLIALESVEQSLQGSFTLFDHEGVLQPRLSLLNKLSEIQLVLDIVIGKVLCLSKVCNRSIQVLDRGRNVCCVGEGTW